MIRHCSVFASLLGLSLLVGCQSGGEKKVLNWSTEPGPSNRHVFGEEGDSGGTQTVSRSHNGHDSAEMAVLREENQSVEPETGERVIAAREGRQTPAVFQGEVENAPGEQVYVREQDKHFGLEFTVLPGYRQDDLHWSIAALTGTPNILSELQWKELEIFNLGGSLKFTTPWNVILKGKGGYGWILSGDNQDSDYLGDDRTFEFSRSNNKADSGHVLDGGGAIGYPFDFTARDELDPWLTFTPLVGYSYHEQNLRVTDGFQTFPPLGSFPGLDSSYDASWQGPWLGFDTDFAVTDAWDVYAGFEYHFADYSADADWNLRTDFQHPVSFTHDAAGYGIVIDVNSRYKFNDYLALLLQGYYQYWEVKNGTDTKFLFNGSEVSTNLNEVIWTSFGFNLGLQFSF